MKGFQFPISHDMTTLTLSKCKMEKNIYKPLWQKKTFTTELTPLQKAKNNTPLHLHLYMRKGTQIPLHLHLNKKTSSLTA